MPLPLRLPGELAPFVIGGMAAAIAVAFVLGWVLIEGAGLSGIGIVVAGGAVLYGGLLYVVGRVQERSGAGSAGEAFGFSFKGWRDVRLGFLVFVMAAVLSAVANSMFVESERFSGENTELYRHFRDDLAAYAVLVVLAVVVAPLVEELFFRGVLLPVLTDRIGPGRALVAQAALFGLVHIDPFAGTHNVSVVVVVAAMGWVVGWAAQHYGRLGPSIVAHALHNGLALTLLFFS